MTHASSESLQAYAAGTLRTGARLAVGLHLNACPQCRREVARLEALAGVLLESGPSEPLSQGALARVMERLDAPAVAPRRLDQAQIFAGGWWMPVGPGLSIKVLKGIADPGERAYLIRAAGGAPLPDHGHNGREWTAVISGAFEDNTGRHGPGDLVECDADEHHQPVALPGETCLCLAVTEGPLKLSGIARLIQPILGL